MVCDSSESFCAVFRSIQRDSIFEFRPVGYGQQSWYDITNAVEKAEIPWIIVEQDEPSMKMVPLDCVKKAIDYLKTID